MCNSEPIEHEATVTDGGRWPMILSDVSGHEEGQRWIHCWLLDQPCFAKVNRLQLVNLAPPIAARGTLTKEADLVWARVVEWYPRYEIELCVLDCRHAWLVCSAPYSFTHPRTKFIDSIAER